MNKVSVSILLPLLCILTLLSGQTPNNRPVIGILTIPSTISGYPGGNWSCFLASYCKFIEAAGARAVPIPYDASYENLTYFFNSVNGILMVGGGSNLINDISKDNIRLQSNYTEKVNFLVDLAIQANDKGDFFPIWATCLSWEALIIVLSRNVFIMENITGDTNIPRNLSFSWAAKNSRLYNQMSDDLWEATITENITLFDHNSSISPESFYHNDYLPEIMSVLSVSYAGYERWFISSAEAVNYPFYGSQYHSEKNTFEWSLIPIPHTPIAILFEQFIANFFVNEARKNNHQYEEDALDKSLIYNWNAEVINSKTMGPMYFFPTVEQNQGMWPGIYDINI